MQINEIKPIPENGAPLRVRTERRHHSPAAANRSAEPGQPAGAEPKPAEPKPVEKITAEREDLEKLKTALTDQGISLKYSLDAETEMLVVRMIDEKTGEAVRQFPSEVSLKLAAEHIKVQGQFVDFEVAE